MVGNVSEKLVFIAERGMILQRDGYLEILRDKVRHVKILRVYWSTN